MMLESWLVVLEASWASFWAGNLIFLDIVYNLFLRSFLSVIAKFYEGAEEMAVRMWTKKLVNPADNSVKLAPT